MLRFNCNHYCGDAPDKVERNRELLCSLLPVRPRMLVIPSSNARYGGEGWMRLFTAFFEEQLKQLEGVDALVSDMDQVCLCISTGLYPVLCYDTGGK